MFPITDPILVFAILVFAILVAPLAADRLRVPDLVLLLIAGVLLGPKGLGVLERSSAVVLFGSVGLLYIMFLAGLEIDLHNFSRTGRRTIVFGLFTFAVPLGLGSLAGRHVIGFSWPTSILLASMFSSHTLLAYPIVSRLGIARSEPVGVTVGATIITDTLALLVLAVIAGSARETGLDAGFWIGITAGMAALILLAWQGIPRLARWFFQRVTEEGNAQYLFVLAIICFGSYFSHAARLEPIIGAFLVGAALNRLIPEHGALMNRVQFAGNTLFIPFFLISVGMLVDPGALIRDPRSWLVAAVMIVMVVLTKYAAAWLTGTIFGYRREDKQVMFGLSVVQAAATLAAVLIGYEIEIFGASVLNGAIAMIAVTCPLGAWITDRYGRKMAENAKPVPRSARIEQRLLVLIANPASAARVLDFAFLLRDPVRPGAIHPVTIVRDEGDTEDAVTRGEKLLADCLAHADSADIPVEPSVRVDMNISDGIIRASKELRSSAVLAGLDAPRPRRGRLFSSIIVHLLEACPARIFIGSLRRPLNTSSRMLILFPPVAERRRDLSLLLRDLKHLARQAGTDMRAYLAGKNTGDLRAKLEKTPPDRPVAIMEFESMTEARSAMLEEIKIDDILILPGERRESALWTPTQDKLMEMLLSRFSENNVVIAYPDIPVEDEYMSLEIPDPCADAPVLHPLEIDPGTGIGKALRDMAAAAFPDNANAAEEARRLLAAAADSYPVEMTEDAVLLHAHCRGLGQPALIVGHGRKCCDIPGLKMSPRIILALLSPATSTPECHLKILAELGRRFHDKVVLERIRNAGSAAEICAIINEDASAQGA